MSGRSPKTKGNTGERQVVALAQEAGLTAVRAWGSDGRALGQATTCDVLIDNQPYQVKRRANIAEYVKPPVGTVGTLIREDRGEWLAVIPAKLYFDLLRRIGECS